MKLWQCHVCREMKLQCQLITDDDIIPIRCVNRKFPPEIAKWGKIDPDELLEVSGK